MVERGHICWGGGGKHPCRHILNVRHISASYGRVQALEDITFEAGCGHTLALIGPNGAGKSTLIKILARLLRPTAGEILWNGQPLARFPHETAYLPQRSEVNWSFPLTVRDLVAMGRYPALGMWRTAAPHDLRIVDKALRTMELEPLQHRQISALSGGQQQRVFLARALAQEAHILLLDEPFTGLDLRGAEALGDLLRALAVEGRLIIASHHDLHTAPALFDRALLLKRRAAAFGPVKESLAPDLLAQVFHENTP